MSVKLDVKFSMFSTLQIFVLLYICFDGQPLSQVAAASVAHNNIIGLTLPHSPLAEISSLKSTCSCIQASQYRITKFADLVANLDELECIFASGLTPASIGLGNYYGPLLTAANNLKGIPIHLNEQHYVSKVECKNQQEFTGTKMVGMSPGSMGFPMGAAEWKIKGFPGVVTDNEYQDHKPSIIIDYSKEIEKECPERQGLGSRLFSPVMNQFVDIGRVVGKSEDDGAAILLMKTMIQENPRNRTSIPHYSTVLFYALKNLDPQLIPQDFVAGSPIIVKKNFTYTRTPIREALEKAPLQSALNTIWKTGRSPSNLVTPSPINKTAYQQLLEFVSSGPLSKILAYESVLRHTEDSLPSILQSSSLSLLPLISFLNLIPKHSTTDSRIGLFNNQIGKKDFSGSEDAKNGIQNKNKEGKQKNIIENRSSQEKVNGRRNEEADDVMMRMKMFGAQQGSALQKNSINELMQLMYGEGDGFGTYRQRRLQEIPGTTEKSFDNPRYTLFQLADSKPIETKISRNEFIPVNRIRQTNEQQSEKTVPEKSVDKMEQQETNRQPLILRLPSVIDNSVRNVIPAIPGRAQTAALLRAIGQVDTDEVWGTLQPRKVIGTLISGVRPFTGFPYLLRNNQPDETAAEKRNMVPIDNGFPNLRHLIPSLIRLS